VKDSLKRLEQQIEILVEGSLSRLLGSEISVPVVASQLARAMDESTKWTEDGRACAPDRYALTLHPQDVESLLRQSPRLPDELSRGILGAVRGAGLALLSDPEVSLAADPTLRRFEVRVLAWHSDNPHEFTQAMPRTKTQSGQLPQGAFLIIDGDRHFPLDRPVVNIGRRLDNQLILDDPHVSRTHSQLRARDGRFILFDLGSTGGTLVNGQKATQYILRPGDVIDVAGFRMVYGEDPGGPPDETPVYRAPFPPRPAGDQATHVRSRQDDET
jgi:hypothetical protein